MAREAISSYQAALGIFEMCTKKSDKEDASKRNQESDLILKP
jgi:hypothetical protein